MEKFTKKTQQKEKEIKTNSKKTRDFFCRKLGAILDLSSYHTMKAIQLIYCLRKIQTH